MILVFPFMEAMWRAVRPLASVSLMMFGPCSVSSSRLHVINRPYLARKYIITELSKTGLLTFKQIINKNKILAMEFH